jgi:hypothetical protein
MDRIGCHRLNFVEHPERQRDTFVSKSKAPVTGHARAPPAAARVCIQIASVMLTVDDKPTVMGAR